MSKYDLRYEVYYIGYVSFVNHPKLRHNKCKWKVAVKVIDVNSGKVLIDHDSLEYAVKPNKRDLRKLRALIMWEMKSFIMAGISFSGAYDDIR